MDNKTHLLENTVINHMLRHTAYVSPVTVYAALFTTAPTKVGGGVEVVGGDYVREAVTFSAPVNGATSNSAPVTFPAAAAPWGEVKAVAIMTDPVAGDMLYFGTLASSKTVDKGDTVTFAALALTVAET